MDGSKAIGGQDGQRAFLTSFVQPGRVAVCTAQRKSVACPEAKFPRLAHHTMAYYADGALVQDREGPEELFNGHEDSLPQDNVGGM